MKYGYFYLLMAGLVFTACKSSQTAQTAQTPVGEEQVNMGYGNQQAKTVTSAVSEVDTDATQPHLTLDNYLRRVPGVQVMGSGDNARIRIRGGTTINQEEDPLFVIDGAAFGNSFAQVAQSIDPNDIKSVSVLRDSASASMYGTRANGGVILITTKKKGENPQKKKKK